MRYKVITAKITPRPKPVAKVYHRDEGSLRFLFRDRQVVVIPFPPLCQIYFYFGRQSCKVKTLTVGKGCCFSTTTITNTDELGADLTDSAGCLIAVKLKPGTWIIFSYFEPEHARGTRLNEATESTPATLIRELHTFT